MEKFSVGKLKILISKEHRNLAMNLILVNNLSFEKSRILDNMDLELIIKARNKNDFEEVFSENGINAKFGEPYGAFAYMFRYRHRVGLFLGIFIFVISVYLSSLFVWRIDISGNEFTSDKEIIEILEKSGFSLGSFVPTLDYDTVHNRFLMESENISWISINITGSVANVLVRERMKENLPSNNTYSNVVAKYDAQIAMIHIYNGKKVVSIGDVVKKGELLITGIIDSQSQGVRYVHASGEIKGYVNKPILVKIPFKSVEKQYTGLEFEEKSLKIFSKIINFSLKYRNYIELCDKIESTKIAYPFSKLKLPIMVTTTKYKEYELKEISYSYDEAVDIAFSRLRGEMDEALKDAELISKSISISNDDEYLYIECNLYCLENVAELVEFEVE